MIHIYGLTAKQKALMDIMWSMDDLEVVQRFIKSLPLRDAVDAHSLIKIAIEESLEEEGRLQDYEDQARSIIDHARNS